MANNRSTGQRAAADLLAFYADAGVDAAVGEEAKNRLSPHDAVATATPPSQPQNTSPDFGGKIPSRSGDLRATASPPRVTAPPAPNAAVMAAREAARTATDLDQLRAILDAFDGCSLKASASRLVFADGTPKSRLMLVGEAPGAEEDARGEPFVGQAGRLLDNMLASIGLARGENVYICNVLKCRPPGNRNPEPFEVGQCSPHLLRQLELIEPKLILAMGRFAVQALLATEASIASLRGRLHRYQGVPLVVTYHPAYLLRNLPDKAKAWEDLCFARRTIAAL
jgi:uracil-DNA glycosylase